MGMAAAWDGYSMGCHAYGHKAIDSSGLYYPEMLGSNTTNQLLSVAAAAWGVSETAALGIMQDFRFMPRQLVFEADFWPTLHGITQTRLAAATPLPSEFFLMLFEAFDILCSYEIGMMRSNFRLFPATDDIAIRLLHVGHFGTVSWRFAGANRDAPMHAIAGGRIVVLALNMAPMDAPRQDVE